VRFRLEWEAELPVDSPRIGEKVPVTIEHAVVRDVRGPYGIPEAERTGTPEAGRPRVGKEDLHGAAILVDLGEHLVAPSATWEVAARLEKTAMGNHGPREVAAAKGLDLEASTLAEALDALEGWTADWWERLDWTTARLHKEDSSVVMSRWRPLRNPNSPMRGAASF
jgi:hypothetical protein